LRLRDKQPNSAALRSSPFIRYAFAGLDLTLDEYLNRHPVTGLLIAKDNTILVERYQYVPEVSRASERKYLPF
jgi:hypothetical protein